MKRLLDWYFAKRLASVMPKDLDGQNAWIKARFATWQVVWHDLFDRDPVLIAEGEGVRPDPLPDGPGDDFRLVFGFSHATAETRRQCFSLFPAGEEMHRRFESYMNGKSVPMTEAEARERLVQVGVLIGGMAPNEAVDFSSVRVVDRETEAGMEALERAGNITELLERSLLDPTPVEHLMSLAAKLFLAEPLWVAAGNFVHVHVHDWVTAAMVGGDDDAVHALLYGMWDGGWQVHHDDGGIVLARRGV